MPNAASFSSAISPSGWHSAASAARARSSGPDDPFDELGRARRLEHLQHVDDARVVHRRALEVDAVGEDLLGELAIEPREPAA